MYPAASLSDLVDSLQFQNDAYVSYFDRQTGEIVSVERSILSAVEEGEDEGLEDDVPEWQEPQVETARAIVADKGDRFIPPPNKFKFHEYQHMEQFIETVASPRIADQLWQAIKGRGAFRVFKDTLYRLDMENRWYRYRDQAMKQFAIEWAEANHVAYKDDFKPTYK
jgi:hypothetical protein